MIFRVDYGDSIIYIISMDDTLDFSWLANDTTPKFTWDDILKPDGVADQAFGVVTPDPRDTVKHDTYTGIAEGGIILAIAIFFCVFFSQK